MREAEIKQISSISTVLLAIVIYYRNAHAEEMLFFHGLYSTQLVIYEVPSLQPLKC